MQFPLCYFHVIHVIDENNNHIVQYHEFFITNKSILCMYSYVFLQLVITFQISLTTMQIR